MNRTHALALPGAAVLAVLAGGTAAGAARPHFPARTAAELVRLEKYTPPQIKATYRVSTAGKAQYDVLIAAVGSHIRIKVTSGKSVAEVGLTNGKIVWSCGHNAGAAFSCVTEADEDRAGAVVIALAYPVTGNFVEKEFAAAFKLPSARVYQTRDLGRAVSCFRATTTKGEVRTCAAADGMVTRTHWRDVDVVALSGGDHATAHDVARPATG